MNVTVGEGVSDGVALGSEVSVASGVEETTRAVCVAAAAAVSTMAVLIEFGSNVGTGAEGAKGDAQARMTVSARIAKDSRFTRSNMVCPRCDLWLRARI